jgi:hypothetical protein
MFGIEAIRDNEIAVANPAMPAPAIITCRVSFLSAILEKKSPPPKETK